VEGGIAETKTKEATLSATASVLLVKPVVLVYDQVYLVSC